MRRAASRVVPTSDKWGGKDVMAIYGTKAGGAIHHEVKQIPTITNGSYASLRGRREQPRR